MFYFLFLFFFINSNFLCLYSMEKHSEKLDYVNQLMPFIRFPNVRYSEWTYQPLAENFKQEDAWKLHIVPSLFSLDATTCQQAQKNCEILLREINNYQQRLQTKQTEMRIDQCCGICFPICVLITQIIFGLYGPLPTIISARAAYKSTQKLGDLDTIEQAYKRHEQQLNFIKNEISETVTKSKDSNQRQAFLKKLTQTHIDNAEKYLNISQNFMEILKKNSLHTKND